MSICVIDSVTLEPYSGERMIIVSGYNCDEVKKWFVDAFGSAPSNNLKDIKKFHNAKQDWLDWLEDHREDFAEFDKDGGSSGHGMYSFSKGKRTGEKLRMLILKYGFSPNNPDNMRTLAHEVLHLCQEFLPTFFNRDEEMEAEAYFHSYIMLYCYQLFL
jgi:hypothetical protein